MHVLRYILYFQVDFDTDELPDLPVAFILWQPLFLYHPLRPLAIQLLLIRLHQRQALVLQKPAEAWVSPAALASLSSPATFGSSAHPAALGSPTAVVSPTP